MQKKKKKKRPTMPSSSSSAVKPDDGSGSTTAKPDVEDSRTAKHRAKDSVFTDLFRDKRYLLQLYQALHPEDKTATEDSLTDITINNVLINGQYNDLGFMVNGKLMILTEAQSTWSMNIIVRALLYLVQSLQEHLDREKADLYGSRKVELPESELYVIYTGDRKKHPKEISLMEEFFAERQSAVEVKVKMLYGTVNPERSDGEDIIGQYVIFSKVFNEQVRLHGRTVKAVSETLRICMDQNVLKEYLESRKKEVVTMMMDLYDQDRILEIHIESEKKIAAEEAAEKAAEKAAKKAEEEQNAVIERMLRDGSLSIDKIASFIGVPLQRVRKIETQMLQES
ncbi:MAG: hypothetical protein LUI39_14075 [Lachnospiraceae bacterium]|nr:hypothetical protein [Lachnospiraceae bacterium]